MIPRSCDLFLHWRAYYTIVLYTLHQPQYSLSHSFPVYRDKKYNQTHWQYKLLTWHYQFQNSNLHERLIKVKINTCIGCFFILSFSATGAKPEERSLTLSMLICPLYYNLDLQTFHWSQRKPASRWAQSYIPKTNTAVFYQCYHKKYPEHWKDFLEGSILLYSRQWR